MVFSTLVSTADLADHLDGWRVFDCRHDLTKPELGESQYRAAHIPGARMIRASEIVASREGIPNELPALADLKRIFERAGVNDDSRIVLYGERSGLLAARGYFTLD